MSTFEDDFDDDDLDDVEVFDMDELLNAPPRQLWAQLDMQGLVVNLPACPGGNIYEVDLERLTTEGRILRTIQHLSKKPWMQKGRCLADFIEALDRGVQLRFGITLYEIGGRRLDWTTGKVR